MTAQVKAANKAKPSGRRTRGKSASSTLIKELNPALEGISAENGA